MKKVLLFVAFGAVSAPFWLVVLVLGGGANGATPNADGSCIPNSGTTTSLGLNASQTSIATTIVNLATKAGGTQAAVVAVTTAYTESQLQNLPGGLGGAKGVFQQTPPAWGTTAQVTDVEHATKSFLAALLRVPGWQGMPAWQAAQAVQGSGAGKKSHGSANYGPNVALATKIVASITGAVAATGCVGTGAGNATSSFTQNTSVAYVGPYPPAQLMARAQAYVAANNAANKNPYFPSVRPLGAGGTWQGACQQFAGFMAGMTESGWPSASDGWTHLQKLGLAHPVGSADALSPPPGAWLYYKSSKPAGHVADYLGGGLVAGTDTWGDGKVGIGPASDLTNGRWHLTYLGWATPKHG